MAGASDTTHGELRFARGSNTSIRYHSILTRHSNAVSRSALDFLIHDPSITSVPANTSQRRVVTLQGDGKCGINLATTPTEALDVNGNIKCTDLKFEYGGSEATLSTVGFITASSSDTLTNKSMTKNQISDFPNIPTQTSELSNNSGFITSSSSDTLTNK